jgi:hypothetical protein
LFRLHRLKGEDRLQGLQRTASEPQTGPVSMVSGL